MKKLYFILLCIPVLLHAQDTIAPKSNKGHFGEFEHRFNLYYMQPVAVGNNVLAKANSSIYGLGGSFSALTWYRVYLNIGITYEKYRVTDASLAANVDYTEIAKGYVELAYKYHFTPRLSVDAKAGCGLGGNLRQYSNHKDYGDQNIQVVFGGLDVDYDIGKIAFFTGINYSFINAEVATVPELKDFYGRLRTLTILIGIKL